MKRNKTTAQPTRIMPKRSGTRQNAVEEPAVKKRTPKAKVNSSPAPDDKEQSTSALENNIASTSCASPDANCSICLCSIDNRAFTDSCYHTFCFKCLLEWSRVRAVCPLCKKSFSAIVHDFRSYDDYQLYQLPRRDTTDDNDDVRVSSAHIYGHSMLPSAPSMNAPPAIAWIHPVGFWISPDNHASRLRHAEQMITFRRRVYTEELHLQGVWSSSGHIVRLGYVSPSLFACNPLLVERVRPWILRDLHVILSRLEVPVVCNIILDLLRQYEITSEDFYGRLFPHLGLSTRLFLQELDSFARSPYDIATYDELAIYNSSTVASRLASSHVENISSSDDSDVEITRSETFSVGTRSPFPAMQQQQQQQVNGLLAALHNRVWSALGHGWDSPIPGPSRYSFTTPQDGRYTSDSNSNTGGVSVIEDVHIDSCDESSLLPTAISDCGSDVVVIDSNNGRHSPITLLSSSDTDNEITVLHARDVRLSRRRQRKKKRQVSSDSESQRVGESTDKVVGRSGEAEDLIQIISHDDSCIVPTGVEINDHHKIVHPLVKTESKVQVGHSSNHDDTELPAASSISLDYKETLKSSQPLSSGDLMATPRKVRAKRSRSTSNIETKDYDKSLKLPACKKHISGHKSSKRKFSDAVLEASNESGVVKCEAFDSVGANGCADDETNFSGDIKLNCDNAGNDSSTIDYNDSSCRERGGQKTNDEHCNETKDGSPDLVDDKRSDVQNSLFEAGCQFSRDLNNPSHSPLRDKLVISDLQASSSKRATESYCIEEQHVLNFTSLATADNTTSLVSVLESENSKSAVINSDTASSDEIDSSNFSELHSAGTSMEHCMNAALLKAISIDPQHVLGHRGFATVGHVSPTAAEPATETTSGNGDLPSSDNMVKLWLSNVSNRPVNDKSNCSNPKCSRRDVHVVETETVSAVNEYSNNCEPYFTDSQVDHRSFEQSNITSGSVIVNSSASSSSARMVDSQLDTECCYRSNRLMESADDKVHVIDDSDEDCVSIVADQESSDSEVEWLPDLSVENSSRYRRCISVSSDDADVELVNVKELDDEVTGSTGLPNSELVVNDTSRGCSERANINNVNDSIMIGFGSVVQKMPGKPEHTDHRTSPSNCDTAQSTSRVCDSESEKYDCASLASDQRSMLVQDCSLSQLLGTQPCDIDVPVNDAMLQDEELCLTQSDITSNCPIINQNSGFNMEFSNCYTSECGTRLDAPVSRNYPADASSVDTSCSMDYSLLCNASSSASIYNSHLHNGCSSYSTDDVQLCNGLSNSSTDGSQLCNAASSSLAGSSNFQNGFSCSPTDDIPSCNGSSSSSPDHSHLCRGSSEESENQIADHNVDTLLVDN